MPVPRRWFRFSLRTLLILITLAACWLGWNVRLVQQRRQILNGHSWHVVQAATWEEFRTLPDYSGFPPEYYEATWRSRWVSAGLPLFGESGFAIVLFTEVPGGDRPTSRQPLIDAFPEASVGVFGDAGVDFISGPLTDHFRRRAGG